VSAVLKVVQLTDDYKPSHEAQLRNALLRAENAEGFLREQRQDRETWAANVEASALKLANERIAQAVAAGVANTDWSEIPSLSPFRVLEAIEFAGGEHLEPDWQVHELVPKVGSGLDVGESKTWKSFKVLDLAAAIHRGVPYRGRPVQKGRSVIVVAEGAHGYPLRMKAYAEHYGVALSELPAIIPAAPNLFQPKQVTALIAQLKILGATYVAIDTKWRCSLGCNENDAGDNAIVFGSLERIAREVGCFCTAISHVGKDPRLGVRGSSSQIAAVDVEVTHERIGDYGTSTVTKLKESQDGAIFTVKMLPVELGISRKTGLPYGSLVVEHVDDAPPKKVKPRKRPEGDALLVLQAMEAKFQTEAPTIEGELFDEVAEQLSAPRPGRRLEYLRKAVRKLADTETSKWLWRHGNRVALTSVLPGDSNEAF
jgi:hypothetical protein